MFYSRKDQSLQLMESSETESETEEEEVDDKFSEMMTHDNHSVTKEGTTKIQKGIAKNTGVFTADAKEAIRHNSNQLGKAKVRRQWCSLFIYHSYVDKQFYMKTWKENYQVDCGLEIAEPHIHRNP